MGSKIFKKLLFLLFFIAESSHADWALMNKASSFNYFSVKNDSLEVNSFNNMDSSISSQGELTFTLDLGSIDTNNSKRNVFIQDLFLETQTFQEASLTAKLGDSFIQSLDFGKAKQKTVNAQFTFHGATQNINLTLLIIRIQGDILIVKTFQPFLLKLTDYKLTDNLIKLRQSSSFENVTDFIPISLNLVYKMY